VGFWVFRLPEFRATGKKKRERKNTALEREAARERKGKGKERE